jgi:hypothetical protein
MRVLKESQVSSLLVPSASDACLALAKLLAVQSGSLLAPTTQLRNAQLSPASPRSPHEGVWATSTRTQPPRQCTVSC